MSFKVILASNFDDDTVDESVVYDGIPTYELASNLVKALNDALVTDNSRYIYRSADDDYELHRWEP